MSLAITLFILLYLVPAIVCAGKVYVAVEDGDIRLMAHEIVNNPTELRKFTEAWGVTNPTEKEVENKITLILYSTSVIPLVNIYGALN